MHQNQLQLESNTGNKQRFQDWAHGFISWNQDHVFFFKYRKKGFIFYRKKCEGKSLKISLETSIKKELQLNKRKAIAEKTKQNQNKNVLKNWTWPKKQVWESEKQAYKENKQFLKKEIALKKRN